MNRTIAAAAVLTLALSGCIATTFRGTEEDLAVNTEPPGAAVQISDGETCTSPCSVRLPRNRAVEVKASKDGCNPQSVTVLPRLGSAAFLYGGILDYGSGAVYDLDPNPVKIALICR